MSPRNVLLGCALLLLLLAACMGDASAAAAARPRRLQGMQLGGGTLRYWGPKLVASQVRVTRAIDAAATTNKAADSTAAGTSEVHDLFAKTPTPYKPDLEPAEHGHPGAPVGNGGRR